MTTSKHRMKNKKKNRIRSKRLKTKTKSLKKGGAAFDKGSYGCVFRPPLHCNNQSFKTEKGLKYISKFMTNVEAEKEISEMKNIKKKLLENGKDNSFINKYYILANEDDVCEIDPKLNKKDLTGAAPVKAQDFRNRNTKINCHDIYESFNIVKNYPHRYRSLNLIDGGSSLHNYLENPLSPESFNKLNKHLIDLLKNGIYTMNQLGIYHCDLKPENLVYDDRIRIIDWGFAVIIDSSNKKEKKQDKRLTETNNKQAAAEAKRKEREKLDQNISLFKILDTMYYGLPFTNVLLIKDIEQGRKLFKELSIEKNKELSIEKKTAPELECKEYYKKIYKEPSPSPYFSLLNTITPKSLNGSGQTLRDYAIDNLVDVIIFSELTNETFFYNVFLPNADIFAFLQIYIKIYKALIGSNQSIINIKEKIINLLYKYILTTKYASTSFDISEIITDLEQLNTKEQQQEPETEVSEQLSQLQINSGGGISQRKHLRHKHSRRKCLRRKHLRRKHSRRKH